MKNILTIPHRIILEGSFAFVSAHWTLSRADLDKRDFAGDKTCLRQNVSPSLLEQLLVQFLCLLTGKWRGGETKFYKERPVLCIRWPFYTLLFALSLLIGIITSVQPSYAEFVGTIESDFDRPGHDISSAVLNSAEPSKCAKLCADHKNCKAYTYVKPGVQGSKATCYLKHTIPKPVTNSCCTSGVKKSALKVVVLEPGLDRPGSNYKDSAISIAEAGVCQNVCSADSKCKAFTYVKPGLQGPLAKCWYKDTLPPAVRNSAFISGRKVMASIFMGMVSGEDRLGHDYMSFQLTRAEPAICSSMCALDSDCKAYSYVKPDVQGPKAKCYLKNKEVAAVKNNCCVSGIRQTGKPVRQSSRVYKIDYLGNHPDNRKSGWAADLQGVANDNQSWYFTQQRLIWKFPVSHDLNTEVTKADPARGILRSFFLGDSRTPAELKGYDHFGDPDEHEGNLFVPVEKTDSDWIPRIAVFDAKNLAFIDSYPLKPGDGFTQNKAGWCAIDPLSGNLYTSNNKIDENNPLFVYQVRFDESRGLILDYVSSEGLWEDTNTLQNINGYMQGGDFSTDGSTLYLLNGRTYSRKKGKFDSKHGGIWVFEVKSGRRIMKSATNGNFKYEFHPEWNKLQEPEGLTVWDLDGKNAPRIPGGQVHAILLNQNVGRADKFWLKHYRVHTRDE